MSPAASLRWAAALVVGLGLLVAASALTRVPVALHGDAEALLRLSWRFDDAVVRECRPPTEQERARMPPHMVRDEICEERIVPYVLTVSLDGAELVDREVRPGGARGDRPLSVHLEAFADPGEHRIRIRFRPAEGGEGASPAVAELPVLEMDTIVVLGPRDVALVTYERDRRRLVLRTPETEGDAGR